jgi:hypothetical protein
MVDDAGSRGTAKMHLLHFCDSCRPVAQRFAEDMCAREDGVPGPVPDLVETLDDRPAIKKIWG